MPNRHKNYFMPFQFYAGFFRGTLPGIKSGPLLYRVSVTQHQLKCSSGSMAYGLPYFSIGTVLIY